MLTRTADARWMGDLKAGKGHVKTGSGALDGAYSFGTRFESAKGTNPEELLGAAHAACFSMALSNALNKAGHLPDHVHTVATVTMSKGDAGFVISGIHLKTEGKVKGLAAADFQQHAEATKKGCIVSQALASVPMTLEAKLV
ncbi:MAG: OsmC family protein [Gemmatimonadota bacterium]|nr:OsmC family protein [Gemmatimonadota bacterium]